MITILPTLEIMRAVTDNNISSSAAQVRRKAFDLATDICTRSSTEILLEGRLWERLSCRLQDDHKEALLGAFRLDNSAINVSGYNHTKAIGWVAKKETKNGGCIILTDNKSSYDEVAGEEALCVLTSQEFLSKIEKFEELMKFVDASDIDLKRIWATNILMKVFFNSQSMSGEMLRNDRVPSKTR